MKTLLCSAVILTVCFLTPRASRATDWWTLSDQDFAQQYATQAFSNTIKDQSSVAWMLFARINQPTQSGGQAVSQWEMWPSNDETFSPAVGLFKAESKVRTRPHLQAPKTAKIGGQENGVHLFSVPPNGGGEEVTRNMTSYTYITQTADLQTQTGVKKFLSSPNAKVDLPIGAVEIKASWAAGATPSVVDIVGAGGRGNHRPVHCRQAVLIIRITDPPRRGFVADIDRRRGRTAILAAL